MKETKKIKSYIVQSTTSSITVKYQNTLDTYII